MLARFVWFLSCIKYYIYTSYIWVIALQSIMTYPMLLQIHPVLKLMTIIWWTYTYAIFIHWCKAHLPNSTKPTFIVSLFLSPSSSVLSMHVCRYKIYRICIQHTHPIQTNLNVLFSELLIRHAPTRQPLYTFRFLLRYNALVIIMEHIP